MTRPDRPYHTHDEKQPLTPGQVYELDIEIWPSCITLPKGFRIALSIRGRDYVYPGGADSGLSNMKNKFTGVGPFLHDDPETGLWKYMVKQSLYITHRHNSPICSAGNTKKINKYRI